MEDTNHKLLIELERVTSERSTLKAENKKLRKENEELRSELEAYESHEKHHQNAPHCELERSQERLKTATLLPLDKIKLFRSIFRGREDVYAYRWVSKAGKTGYSPAKQGGYFENTSKSQDEVEYLPLTDSVIEEHLRGNQIIGIYPLLTDETCWFLAADFDKGDFKHDALAFQNTCSAMGIPAYIEVSRSGKGAHVWIFFEEAIPAELARKLGFAILTQTLESRHQIELSSYDRFFPNQDTLPKGGLGNLIALPLQKQARSMGGSVFVDEAFTPYPDQWEFLSNVGRVAILTAQAIVETAAQKGELIGVQVPSDSDDEDPWTLPPSRRAKTKPLVGPFPEQIRVIQANQLFVPKDGLPSQFITRLKRLAAFQNPEFFKHQAMRLSVYNKPRVISCFEDFEKYIALPRGCFDGLVALLESCGIELQLEDERNHGDELKVSFTGELRDGQERAARELIRHDIGILSAGTAFGKTVVAANLIAKRKRNTLILVHRRQLLDQWREKLSLFLDIPYKEIGVIGGGRKKPTGRIDVGTIQSLIRKGEVADLVGDYGHVIVDECHHVSAFSFEGVLKEVKAQHVLGLTATPKRKDGHHPIVIMQCGPIRYRVSDKEQAKVRSFDHVVIERKTGFMLPQLSEDFNISDLYASLVADRDRSQLIIDDLVSSLEEGRSPLLLTERTAHLEYFEKELQTLPYKTIVLRGGMGKKQRKAAANQIAESNGQQRVILATGRYIGEGFDDSKLDTLFLAMPVSWTGTLQQYVGRLHRLHDQKKVVQVYDYVDHTVPQLQRMFQRRIKGYKSIGYRFVEPAQNTLFAANGV